MKRFILAVAILLGLSVLFISCNKDNGGTGGGSWIVGKWALAPEGNHSFLEEMNAYVEYTKDGFIIGYYLKNTDDLARFENGNLYTPAGATWVRDTEVSLQYTLSENMISIAGYGVPIEKINNDNFIVKGTSLGGNYYRIKNFKTK